MIQNNNLLQLTHLFDANEERIREINKCKEKVDLKSQKKILSIGQIIFVNFKRWI